MDTKTLKIRINKKEAFNYRGATKAINKIVAGFQELKTHLKKKSRNSATQR